MKLIIRVLMFVLVFFSCINVSANDEYCMIEEDTIIADRIMRQGECSLLSVESEDVVSSVEQLISNAFEKHNITTKSATDKTPVLFIELKSLELVFYNSPNVDSQYKQYVSYIGKALSRVRLTKAKYDFYIGKYTIATATRKVQGVVKDRIVMGMYLYLNMDEDAAYTDKNGTVDEINEDIDEYINKFDARCIEILAEELSPEMSHEDIVLAMHEYFENKVSYSYDHDDDDEYIYTLHSAIMDDESVCEGYSLAYKHFLNFVGIPCELVTVNTTIASHMWNQVYLDGHWYHVDVTNDDRDDIDSIGSHMYFLISDATLEEIDSDVHNGWSAPYTCDSDKYKYDQLKDFNYFFSNTKSGFFTSSDVNFCQYVGSGYFKYVRRGAFSVRYYKSKFDGVPVEISYNEYVNLKKEDEQKVSVSMPFISDKGGFEFLDDVTKDAEIVISNNTEANVRGMVISGFFGDRGIMNIDSTPINLDSEEKVIHNITGVEDGADVKCLKIFFIDPYTLMPYNKPVIVNVK